MGVLTEYSLIECFLILCEHTTASSVFLLTDNLRMSLVGKRKVFSKANTLMSKELTTNMCILITGHSKTLKKKRCVE